VKINRTITVTRLLNRVIFFILKTLLVLNVNRTRIIIEKKKPRIRWMSPELSRVLNDEAVNKIDIGYREVKRYMLWACPPRVITAVTVRVWKFVTRVTPYERIWGAPETKPTNRPERTFFRSKRGSYIGGGASNVRAGTRVRDNYYFHLDRSTLYTYVFIYIYLQRPHKIQGRRCRQPCF